MKDQAGSKTAVNFTQQEDRQLIVACLEGDAEAWEALIVRYQRLIYSIPLKARLSTDDAADIFQAVCLKLYEKLSTLREHEKIVAWLITTTTRETWRLSSRQRREGHSTASDSQDDGEGLDQIPATGPLADEQRQVLEQQQIVREGIAAMSERCRELISMLFYQKDDLSYADIATRMRMPVASIGPTRARCLEKLKKLLQGKI
jgi:RNA polymerase sigma factor (sigma-70 family)